MAWAALQVVLYRSKEPALVIIPLMYPVAVMCAVVYERFWCERLPPSLHSRPTAAIRRSRLLAVRRARLGDRAVERAKHLLTQLFVYPPSPQARAHTLRCARCGTPQLRGGAPRPSADGERWVSALRSVLGWSSVSPFTALVIHQDKKLQMSYLALFCFVVAFSFSWEAYWRGQGIPHRGLFSGNHEVEVWAWQVYLYAIATSLGVTANGIILMQLLREKSENAIRAHKMLACSIMPPPVAKEIFEIQWQRIREGKLAQRQMARATRANDQASAPILPPRDVSPPRSAAPPASATPILRFTATTAKPPTYSVCSDPSFRCSSANLPATEFPPRSPRAVTVCTHVIPAEDRARTPATTNEEIRGKR